MATTASAEKLQSSARVGRSEPSRPHTSRSWLWLLVAAGLLLFANGANSVWVAAWLAPIFLLRFVRTQKTLVGLPIAYVLLSATMAFQFRGMVPIPGIAYYGFLVVDGLTLVAPYVLDRVLAPRIGGFAATLIFPAAWAATDYLVSLGMYGSWGASAYSQYGNLALLQLLSVTGLWGVTFLMGWFAACCNGLWEEGVQSSRARRGLGLCCGVILAVILLGGIRASFLAPSSPTVRIASLSKRNVGQQASDAAWGHLLTNRASDKELDEIRGEGNAVDNDLLARAGQEAQAGAKIVFWGEGNAPVFKEDEPALFARGRELAAKYRIYLGMGIATWNRGQARPLENKLVLITPDGQVAWEYLKARPVPGGEAALSVRTDGRLRSLDTPYGRMSAVICFDGDFPGLLAQAGVLGADILLDPSNDWRAIDPWHTQMASFRAIEQGFNLVRHTSHGLSAAFDYQGRRLSAMDHYQTGDYVLISEVPTKGVRTIYGRLRDWFAWLCLALVAALALRAARPSHRAM